MKELHDKSCHNIFTSVFMDT